MPASNFARYSSSTFRLADLVFICVIAIYCWLVLNGIMTLSGDGALIDSDLQTYAQGMAGAARPQLFLADPALHASSPANSIPNLERWLALKLTPGDAWATGLLRAGCVAIFCFFCGWYFLGRWLFTAPSLAALLSVACGITIWIGWGTFWGILHSDPVPRVFFAAILPFILWLAFLGITHVSLRPLACFSAGCAIWIHGVSALNCGAMLLVCYFLIPPERMSFARNFAITCICALTFLAPVLIFLWPSLSQTHRFSSEDMAVFQELFALRWQADYGRFASRLAAFFSPANAAFPIFLGGIAGWIAIFLKGTGRARLLCSAVPACALGIFATAFICWAESTFAPRFGRLPMGHELIRGMRLLLPLAWLLIVGGIGALTGKQIRRLILAACTLAIILLSQDRQHQAAIYSFQEHTGLEHGERLGDEAAQGAALRDVFKAVEKLVPEGEVIYSPVDAMQTRYLAQRPLAHSFKDGYIFFYNKDVEGSRRWLALEKALREKGGIRKAWRLSGSHWMLVPEEMFAEASLPREVVMRKNGWLLLHSLGNRD